MPNQQSKPVTIPAAQAQRNFSELIRRAASGNEHFIVAQDGVPMVVIISIGEYVALVRGREQHATEAAQQQVGRQTDDHSNAG